MDSFGYERILVPTDMSDFGNLAARFAAMFAERLGSRITLLYAGETWFPMDVLEMPIGYYIENAPETKAKLQEKLRAFANDVLPGVPVEATVVDEAPARAIVQTANQMRADLIVMGTHGRHGWRRTLLGSVTEAVLHETDVPVLTVTPGIMRDDGAPALRTIVCPVNFTYIARKSLHHASVLTKAFDAELVVVYVTEAIETPKLPEVEAAFSL